MPCIPVSGAIWAEEGSEREWKNPTCNLLQSMVDRVVMDLVGNKAIDQTIHAGGLNSNKTEEVRTQRISAR